MLESNCKRFGCENMKYLIAIVLLALLLLVGCVKTDYKSEQKCREYCEGMAMSMMIDNNCPSFWDDSFNNTKCRCEKILMR